MADGAISKLPRAEHASPEAVANWIAHHGAAVSEVAHFIANFEGGVTAGLEAASERWPDLRIAEVELINLLVRAMLEDRVRRAEVA